MAIAAIFLAALASVGPVETFNAAVERYQALSKEAGKSIPELKDRTVPEKIAERERALGAAIRKARAKAKPGAIFTPAVKSYFTTIVRAELKGKANQSTQESAKQGNPRYTEEAEFTPKLAINAAYPKAAPLATMPVSILMKLPKLPENLEYRFIGRHLILRDTAANIIVDYMVEVAPQL